MNTVEAYEKLVALHPKRECKVWDWINPLGDRSMHLDVDEYTARGQSWEECFANLNPPPAKDKVAEKRAEAAKLLAEAEVLEAATATAGEAVAS
jgi:hypothetical protein